MLDSSSNLPAKKGSISGALMWIFQVSHVACWPSRIAIRSGLSSRATIESMVRRSSRMYLGTDDRTPSLRSRSVRVAKDCDKVDGVGLEREGKHGYGERRFVKLLCQVLLLFVS